MTGYYDTALIALRSLEQSRLDVGVARDQLKQQVIDLHARIEELEEERQRPAGFPADWRDQIRKLSISPYENVVMDDVIRLIVAWQAAAK